MKVYTVVFQVALSLVVRQIKDCTSHLIKVAQYSLKKNGKFSS
jgi:hypothetical protein